MVQCSAVQREEGQSVSVIEKRKGEGEGDDDSVERRDY